MKRRPYPDRPYIQTDSTPAGVEFYCWRCRMGRFYPAADMVGTTNHVLVHRHFEDLRVMFQNASAN